MAGHIEINKLIVRLRREGGGLVMGVPLAVRDALQLTAGDVMVISADPPNLVATKIDITRALADVQKSKGNGGE